MTDWNECDAEALRAALSAVDDWDGSLAALCGFDSDCSSSSDVSRPMKSKSRHTTAPYTVKQRKQEIAALRAEVEELQNIVALEKALDHDALQPTAALAATVEETALQLEWERLASSQKYERFAVELENAKLRKLLQSQKKTAEKIMSLTKRVRVLEVALPAAHEAPSFENYRMPHVDAQSQLQRLEELVPYAEEIFSSGAFAASGSQCFREMHFRDTKPTAKGVDFEIAAAWVLPFPVDRVVDALWLQTTRPSFKSKTVAFQDVSRNPSSLVSQFISTVRTGEEWGASQGQFAASKFPPNPIDDSILIGITTKARAYQGVNCLTSVHMDGWLQVKSMVRVNSPPLTQIKWHRHMILDPSEIGHMNNSQHCKWTQRIIGGPSRLRVNEELEWSLQTIENLLLE